MITLGFFGFTTLHWKPLYDRNNVFIIYFKLPWFKYSFVQSRLPITTTSNLQGKSKKFRVVVYREQTSKETYLLYF